MRNLDAQSMPAPLAHKSQSVLGKDRNLRDVIMNIQELSLKIDGVVLSTQSRLFGDDIPLEALSSVPDMPSMLDILLDIEGNLRDAVRIAENTLNRM